jgi:hypothetical protein
MHRVVLLAVLLCTPLAVYWQTVFSEYGFRDDYSLLREAHEDPGKLARLTSSSGRPVYGVLLEASLQHARIVPDLPWLRLASVALLTLVGLALWWQLRRAGWSDTQAAAIGLAFTLLPGSQVSVGWAIAWPIVLALLFTVLGFALVEATLQRRGPKLRGAALAGGACCYFVAGLTYQSSAMFAVVPLAGLLLLRPDDEPLRDVRWIVAHLATLFVSVVTGFLLMQVAFVEGVVPEAARMHLEPHPLIKLIWFYNQPVLNALGLFELRDRFDTQPAFWIAVATSVAILALGFRAGGRGMVQQARWFFCLFALPFVAHGVSLAATSQATGYRTLLPLSGLILLMVVFALRRLAAAGWIRAATQHVALALLVVFAVASAQRNAFKLIAEPQGREWQLVRDAVFGLTLKADTAVFVITPNVLDRSTERVHEDEFGSLSSDADWAVREMFKAALRERFGDQLPTGYAYFLLTDYRAPEVPEIYDLVLDLRKLKETGDRRIARATSADPTSRR